MSNIIIKPSSWILTQETEQKQKQKAYDLSPGLSIGKRVFLSLSLSIIPENKWGKRIKPTRTEAEKDDWDFISLGKESESREKERSKIIQMATNGENMLSFIY